MIRIGDEPVAAGCYVDGHHGQYAYDVLCDIATCLTGVDYASLIAEARAADDLDLVIDTADMALDLLNDVTSGGFWEWHDGEVFLTDNSERED